MGGSSGGGIPSSDLKRLEEKAKETLKKASSEARRHVFISFAYEDLGDVNLFRGQAKNENTDLAFDDYSVKEAFESTNADYVRRQIREKIDRCSVTVVYLSKSSAASKWVNWEIEESLRRGKGVIGLHKGDVPPKDMPPALAASGCQVVKWEHAALIKAIEAASAKR
jgi:hypothetical protein